MALFFRQAFTLGGNSINCYHPARAQPRDKQSFNLCCVDNTSLLIHYCSILYSNASKMHCFTCSSVVTIYGVFAKNFRLAKKVCHFFCPPRGCILRNLVITSPILRDLQNSESFQVPLGFRLYLGLRALEASKAPEVVYPFSDDVFEKCFIRERESRSSR